MTREEYAGRYRLLRAIVRDKISTYEAEAADGEKVLLHFLGDRNAAEMKGLRENIHRRGENTRASVVEYLALNGCQILVTTPIPGFTTLAAWLTAPSPASQNPDVRPIEIATKQASGEPSPPQEPSPRPGPRQVTPQGPLPRPAPGLSGAFEPVETPPHVPKTSLPDGVEKGGFTGAFDAEKPVRQSKASEAPQPPDRPAGQVPQAADAPDQKPGGSFTRFFEPVAEQAKPESHPDPSLRGKVDKPVGLQPSKSEGSFSSVFEKLEAPDDASVSRPEPPTHDSNPRPRSFSDAFELAPPQEESGERPQISARPVPPTPPEVRPNEDDLDFWQNVESDPPSPDTSEAEGSNPFDVSGNKPEKQLAWNPQKRHRPDSQKPVIRPGKDFTKSPPDPPVAGRNVPSIARQESVWNPPEEETGIKPAVPPLVPPIIPRRPQLVEPPSDQIPQILDPHDQPGESKPDPEWVNRIQGGSHPVPPAGVSPPNPRGGQQSPNIAPPAPPSEWSDQNTGTGDRGVGVADSDGWGLEPVEPAHGDEKRFGVVFWVSVGAAVVAIVLLGIGFAVG